MVLSIINEKGGQGKSMIAHQLITSFGYKGFEIDPYGSLAERLPESVKSIPLNSVSLPKVEDDNIVFDFGGFADKKTKEAISVSDLVIVPFIPTLESVQATEGTISNILPHLIEFEKPLLLVANMVVKEADINDALIVFADTIGISVNDLDYGIIPQLTSIQSAINENISVIEMAKRGGFKGHPYRKAAQRIHELHDKILEYK